MNNEPIVLCDEALAGINGGEIVSQMVSDMLNAAVSLANLAYQQAMSIASVINSQLGPPGAYNPYSNPINCEYGGYY